MSIWVRDTTASKRNSAEKFVSVIQWHHFHSEREVKLNTASHAHICHSHPAQSPPTPDPPQQAHVFIPHWLRSPPLSLSQPVTGNSSNQPKPWNPKKSSQPQPCVTHPHSTDLHPTKKFTVSPPNNCTKPRNSESPSQVPPVPPEKNLASTSRPPLTHPQIELMHKEIAEQLGAGLPHPYDSGIFSVTHHKEGATYIAQLNFHPSLINGSHGTAAESKILRKGESKSEIVRAMVRLLCALDPSGTAYRKLSWIKGAKEVDRSLRFGALS